MAGISKGLGFFLIVDRVNMILGLGKIEQMSIKAWFHLEIFCRWKNSANIEVVWLEVVFSFDNLMVKYLRPWSLR